MKIYVNYWNSNMEDERPFRLSVDKEAMELLKNELVRRAIAVLSNENGAEEAFNCLSGWKDIDEAIEEWEEDMLKHKQEERNDE